MSSARRVSNRRRLTRALALAALVGAGACESEPRCVAVGTRVRTRRGERVIESLEVGDELVCVDPATGEVLDTRVTRVVRGKRECARLGGAGFELVLTTDHPLFDPEAREWAPAGDWVVGKRRWLRTLLGDEVGSAEITLREPFHTLTDVLDLTVDHELHTFVANGVVVHNKQPPCFYSEEGCIADSSPIAPPDGGIVAFGDSRVPPLSDASDSNDSADSNDSNDSNDSADPNDSSDANDSP